MTQNEFLRGPRINPKPVTGKETVADLVDNAFLASFRQAAGVVGQERVIDEVGDRFLPGDRLRIDPRSAQEFVLRHRGACAVLIARKARVRRSRASMIQRRVSFGSSVTRKRLRSSGEIFPSPATRSLSHSARPRQYSRPNSTTGNCFTLPVCTSVSASNNSSIVP